MPLLLALIGGQELLLIVIVAAVVIFGAAKVPQFMGGVGRGIKEFKQAIKDDPETAAEDKSSGDQSSAS